MIWEWSTIRGELRPGSLFVAMQGGTADGNRFIESAIQQGAVAVVTDSAAAFDRIRRDDCRSLALVEVEHGRRALAQISANFFGHPERKLKLSGVTGTNGKTTTAFLLDAMLNHQGARRFWSGRSSITWPALVKPSPHTTPESRDLLELFAEGVRAGATEAVMEVSSHALHQGRTSGLPFEVAIFTNLTRDHLDYHGTMESYFEAKRMLFDGSQVAPPRFAVINLDDAYGVQMAEAALSAGRKSSPMGFSVAPFAPATSSCPLRECSFR